MSFHQFVHSEGSNGSKAVVIIAAVKSVGAANNINRHVKDIQGSCCADVKRKFRKHALCHHADKHGENEDFFKLTNAKEKALVNCEVCPVKKQTPKKHHHHHKGRQKTSTSAKKQTPKKHHHHRKGRQKTSTSAKKEAKRRRKREKLHKQEKLRKQQERAEQHEKYIGIVGAGALITGGIVISQQKKGHRTLLRQRSEEAYKHVTGHTKRYKK